MRALAWLASKYLLLHYAHAVVSLLLLRLPVFSGVESENTDVLNASASAVDESGKVKRRFCAAFETECFGMGRKNLFCPAEHRVGRPELVVEDIDSGIPDSVPCVPVHVHY